MTDESKYTGIAGLLPKMVVDIFNKFNKNLVKGNPAAALSKSKKAAAQKKQQREWAIETFISNPYWDYDKTAGHVHKIATQHGHKLANLQPYKLSTIRKTIQGTRDEASKRNSEKSKN